MAKSSYEFYLGDRIYLLVSTYKDYVSIGIRECFTYGSRVLPTRNGVNLMLRQYSLLCSKSGEILEDLKKSEYTTATFDLGYNVTATAGTIYSPEGSKMCLLIENSVIKANIELTLAQFETLIKHGDQISLAVDALFIPKPPVGSIVKKDAATIAEVQPNGNDEDIIAAEIDYVSLCVIIVQKLIQGLKLTAMHTDDHDAEFVMDPRVLLEKKINLSKYGRVKLPSLIDKLIDKRRTIRIIYFRYVTVEKIDLLPKIAANLDLIENKYLSTAEGKQIIRKAFMSYVE
jgi:hypothetical protein